MAVSTLKEEPVEEAALSWFNGLGYSVLHGPEVGLEERRARTMCDAPLLQLMSGGIRAKDLETLARKVETA